MAFDFKKLETKEMQIEYRKLSEKDLNTFIGNENKSAERRRCKRRY